MRAGIINEIISEAAADWKPAGSSRGSGISFTIGVRSLCSEVPVC